MLRERENASTENASFSIGGGSLVSAPANPLLLPVGQLQPVTGGAENELVMRETRSTSTEQADIQTGGGPPLTVPANPVQGPMETDRPTGVDKETDGQRETDRQADARSDGWTSGRTERQGA